MPSLPACARAAEIPLHSGFSRSTLSCSLLAGQESLPEAAQGCPCHPAGLEEVEGECGGQDSTGKESEASQSNN